MSGICCPVTIGIGCTPEGGLTGGWAASIEECVFDNGCCDVYYDDAMDQFGCATREQGRDNSFCLGQVDAGTDTGSGSDAGI